MCSNIEDVLRKFEDQDEKGKLARDSLNAMMELAGQRSDAFYTQVTYARSYAPSEVRLDTNNR